MALDHATLVNAYYWAVLGRAPDEDGFRFWVGKMDEGLVAEDVAYLFLRSAERLAVQPAEQDAGTFIDGCYRDLLQRAADASGKEYWLGRLTQLADGHEDARAAVIGEMVDYLANPQGSSDDQLAFQQRLAAWTPDSPGLRLQQDTGISASDGITRDNQVGVHLPQGVEHWDYSTDGGQTWLDAPATGLLLSDGRYEVGAVQVRYEQAGATLTLTNTVSWVIDTEAPESVVFKYFDNGGLTNDHRSHDGRIILPALAGEDTWRYSSDGGAHWQPGNSTGSFELAEGRYQAGSLLVERFDTAGNSTLSVNDSLYIVDQTAPTLVSVGQTSFGRVLPANVINISYAPVLVTDGDWYGFSYELSRNGFLQDLDSGARLAVVYLSGAGRFQNAWNLGLDGDLQAGHHYSLYLPEGTVTDLAGNGSAEVQLMGVANTFVAA